MTLCTEDEMELDRQATLLQANAALSAAWRPAAMHSAVMARHLLNLHLQAASDPTALAAAAAAAAAAASLSHHPSAASPQYFSPSQPSAPSSTSSSDKMAAHHHLLSPPVPPPSSLYANIYGNLLTSLQQPPSAFNLGSFMTPPTPPLSSTSSPSSPAASLTSSSPASFRGGAYLTSTAFQASGHRYHPYAAFSPLESRAPKT